MKIGVSLASRLEFLARVTDMAVLASALRSGHDFVQQLVAAARRCIAEAQRLRLL